MYKKSDYTRESNISQHLNSYRSEFRRDYARLIHSAAFRRLQGKTQLFPGIESDFFRNRLTHSIEVAQIAKSIAIKLNNEYFDTSKIDLDLVEVAGLAHDLGHPPFGHNGEKALDDSMRKYGGFEGNAQTLRILSKLEKKEIKESDGVTLSNNVSTLRYGVDKEGNDFRLGLNLTYRTLSCVLKYDSEIPLQRENGGEIHKGYYHSESGLVKKLKQGVVQRSEYDKFKTIECQIMDIADDIAYSTYDLEDAMKAGFLTPLDMMSADESIFEKVAYKVRKNIRDKEFNKNDVLKVLLKIFFSEKMLDLESLGISSENLMRKFINFISTEGIKKQHEFSDDLLRKLGINVYFDPKDIKQLIGYEFFEILGVSYRSAIEFGQSGYFRTRFTSNLIDSFINGVKVQHLNEEIPALSIIELEEEKLIMVETLKHLVFELITMSPRLQVVKYRGYEIVKSIFDALTSDDGYFLLPDDCRSLYTYFNDDMNKKRVICDFIAGMTDRYAIEFYSRLKSESAQTIFKPI